MIDVLSKYAVVVPIKARALPMSSQEQWKG